MAGLRSRVESAEKLRRDRATLRVRAGFEELTDREIAHALLPLKQGREPEPEEAAALEKLERAVTEAMVADAVGPVATTSGAQIARRMREMLRGSGVLGARKSSIEREMATLIRERREVIG